MKAVTPPVVTPKLMVSTSSNRANPVPLQGANLDGTVYIYLDPGTVAGISQVEFTIIWSKWLKLSTVDKKVPYDLAGTDNQGQREPGVHQVAAHRELRTEGDDPHRERQEADDQLDVQDRPSQSRTPCSSTDVCAVPIPAHSCSSQVRSAETTSRSKARPDIAVDGVDHVLGVRGAGRDDGEPEHAALAGVLLGDFGGGHGEAPAGSFQHRLHDLALVLQRSRVDDPDLHLERQDVHARIVVGGRRGTGVGGASPGDGPIRRLV